MTLTLDDTFTVPTRTGTRCPTDACSATSAAPAGCATASAASASSARGATTVVLTSYGRSSGFCVDPIEKKPLNHFLPGGGAVVRHRRLQPRVQVLPELGHLEVAGDRHAAGRGVAEELARVAGNSAAAASHSPTTIRRSSTSMRSTSRTRAASTGSRPWP